MIGDLEAAEVAKSLFAVSKVAIALHINEDQRPQTGSAGFLS